MKVIALIAILSLVSISNCADAKCDTWKCAASGVEVKADNCAKRVTVDGKKVTNINFQCKSPMVCPVEVIVNPASGDDVPCAPVAIVGRVDGETCADNIKCVDKVTCTSGKCVGLAKDAACKFSTECATGFYCKAEKCTAQIADDKTECATSEECVNTMGCLAKKCTAYGTQKEGVETMEAALCASGEFGQEDAKFVCAKSKLEDKDFNCAADQKVCKYTVTGAKETKAVERNCECSLSNASTQYCPADSSKMAKITPNGGVHTSRRFAGQSASTWPRMEGADDCLKRVFANSSYVKSVLAVLAVLALLI
jgi:hypothetical protein